MHKNNWLVHNCRETVPKMALCNMKRRSENTTKSFSHFGAALELPGQSGGRGRGGEREEEDGSVKQPLNPFRKMSWKRSISYRLWCETDWENNSRNNLLWNPFRNCGRTFPILPWKWCEIKRSKVISKNAPHLNHSRTLSKLAGYCLKNSFVTPLKILQIICVGFSYSNKLSKILENALVEVKR